MYSKAFISRSLVLLSSFILFGSAPLVHAATFTVNSTGDGADANIGDGICADPTDQCTFRAAFEEANATPASDSIHFAIPNSAPGYDAATGTYTVLLGGMLRALHPLVIDGTTQVGYAGVPVIEISGASASGGNGIVIQGGESTIRGLIINRWSLGTALTLDTGGNNVVEGNIIGTNTADSADIGNSRGISLLNSSNNRIGGTTAAARNLVSANGVGIQIEALSTNNVIEGNYIGTDRSGTQALANRDGIAMTNSVNNRIGGTTGVLATACAGACNLISGNDWNGISISSGDGATNLIEGNFIGVDVNGTAALGNGRRGISVGGVFGSVTIGGTSAAAANVISGNTMSGIGTIGNAEIQVLGNRIGTDISGTTSIPNQEHGILISTSNNTIGGSVAGAGNLISGNANYGIQIAGGIGNIIQGNKVGTDINGTTAVPNAEGGINLGSSGGNTSIGGTEAGAGNLISGNTKFGIQTSGNGHTIAGNYIGTDVHGTAALPNTTHGIDLFGQQSVVGGSEPGARNIISGNGSDGLFIRGHNNIVAGNYIGTDVAGTVALPNQRDGVSLDGDANVVGDSLNVDSNIISGNARHGVLISHPLTTNIATANVVINNSIGINALGTDALPNGENGVHATFQGRGNTIEGNVISGNTAAGIQLVSTGQENVVKKNFIGNLRDGTTPMGNGSDGIFINTNRSTVAENTIAFNGGNGVSVATAVASGIAWGFLNIIQRNEIFSNEGIGIDLGPGPNGVTFNDAQDLDSNSGGNRQQNYPVLTGVDATDMRIQGYLNSVPNTTYPLEFFSNVSCDTTNYGEGQAFIGSTEVTTDEAGNASFDVSFPGSEPVGIYITATATHPIDGTSEFSACRQVGEADLSLAKEATPDPLVLGEDLTYTVTLTNEGPGGAYDIALIDTLPPQVDLVSFDSETADCAVEGRVLHCSLEVLAADEVETITLVVKPTSTGNVENFASVTAGQPDANLSNNGGRTVVSVLENANAMGISGFSPEQLVAEDIRQFTLYGQGFEAGASVRLEPTDQVGEDVRPNTVVAEILSLAADSIVVQVDLLDPIFLGDLDVVVENLNGTMAHRPIPVLPSTIYPAARGVGAIGFPIGFPKSNFLEILNMGDEAGYIWFELYPPDPDAIELQIWVEHGPLLWDGTREADPSVATIMLYLEANQVMRLGTTWRVDPADVIFPDEGSAAKPLRIAAGGKVGFNSKRKVSWEGTKGAGKDQLKGIIKQTLINSVCQALGEKLGGLDTSVLDAAIDGALEVLKERGAMSPEDVMNEVGSFLGERTVPGFGQLQLAVDIGTCVGELLNGISNAYKKTAKAAADRARRRTGSSTRAYDQALDKVLKSHKGSVYATHALLQFDKQLRERPCNPPPADREKYEGWVVGPWDPNDKRTNRAYACETGLVDGETRCIRYFVPLANATDPITYTLLFENKDEATAPATRVTVTDILPENLDPSTLEVITSSHLEKLKITEDGQTITFTFDNINLPPNVTPPEGEGFVEFTVQPRIGLADGTEIRNDASIVFDFNPPIETPEVVHVLRALADLVLEGHADKDVAMADEEVAYHFSVRNEGPDPADGIIFTSELEPGASFVSAATTQGSCTQVGSVVTCTLEDLSVGAAATIDVVARGESSGAISQTARVTLNQTEGDPFNNELTLQTLQTPETLVAMEDLAGDLPAVHQLHNNYPNPFNPRSTIRFDVATPSRVVLKVYNIFGQTVRTLVDAPYQPGRYQAVLNGKDLASGLYIYRVQIGNFSDVKKMILLK